MSIRIIAFTDRGMELAKQLVEPLHADAMRCGDPLPLSDWTAAAFAEADGLVFIGAAGIAVRAVAPHIRHKAEDPAVVAVDEGGRFAIPLLSGHLGGANDLARQIAALTGAVPVITTATDGRGVFAVDEWARRQGCVIRNSERIRDISSRLLSGDMICLRSDFPIPGAPPEGVALTEDQTCDVLLSLRPGREQALQVVPKIAVLGVGCRRGTSRIAIEQAFDAICAEGDLCPEAFLQVCSIDRKQNEPGLLAFCESHNLPFQVFSAEELMAVAGDFSGSDFVRQVTGADNVCERSAVMAGNGSLFLPKYTAGGVTMAVALRPFTPTWRWRYG